jgi:hypothetical protein
MFFPWVLGLTIMVLLYANMTVSSRVKTFAMQQRLRTLLVLSIGMLLWPVVFRVVLGKMADNNMALVAFAWPVIILGLHLYLTRFTSNKTRLFRGAPIVSDASTIIGLTFGISSFLGARSKSCSHIFLAAAVGCVAFIMPLPHAPTDTMEFVTIESIQQVILSWSVGLLIAGIVTAQQCTDTRDGGL